ncbi:MAG TPA: DNA translocase FtsK 4TM domain-containing protein [Anaerolineaceae bacterium]|nr:DNA translocase FtsK 4TM domain-containing protein [Anaerolineaceae bacterium]
MPNFLKPSSQKNSKSRTAIKGTSASARKSSPGSAAQKRPMRTGSKPRTPSPRQANPPARRPAPPRAKSRPVLAGLSPERKLDLVGTFLALLGLLTLLSLLSINKGSFTGMWIEFLRQGVGWGVYLLPIALLGVGVWLILRNIETLPQLAVERLAGLVLLYFNLLAFAHLFAGGGAALAEAGRGGGRIGNLILQLLVGGLGEAGAVIVLVAWLLIGLTMLLDLSIPEIFRWLGPVLTRLRAAWDRLLSSRPQPAGANLESSSPAIQQDHYTPLNRPPTPEMPGGGATIPMAAGPLSEPYHPPWVLPPVETILEPGIPAAVNEGADKERGALIEETLRSFGAPGHIVEIHRGPTITQFGLEPDFIENRAGRTRVRVSKIVALADDLALALAAPRIRIQAPVPGRAYVGIEVPNTEISRVTLRDVIESEGFQKIRSPLRFALGEDVAGKAVSADLAAMPHLLIAGTTGSGKSVCVNSFLSCLLMNNTPDDLRLILVDPKRVELTGYNGIPHLLAPVVVDAERVVGALQWMMREMDNRYHKFSQAGARNIVDYNNRLQARGEKKIPYLVIVIDELADLMMLAPDETERTITRLAQLARATGLHLVLATQRPSVDVLTGLIKANFPARIAFAVASGVDSRVILDQPGAERLLGRGDMLFQAPDAPAPVRLQGAYVSDSEIQNLVLYWRAFAAPAEAQPYAGQPVDQPPQGVPLKQIPIWEDMTPQEEEDPMVKEATDLVRREGRASISMLQRRLRIGYTRAARIIDRLEEKKIIGPAEANSQVRAVLDYGPTAPPKEE